MWLVRKKIFSWYMSFSLFELIIYIGDIYIVSEKAMAPHSSTLAWKIPWMEEPVRLQSMGSLRVGHDWATSLWLFTFMHWRRKWQPTPMATHSSVLAWKIPGTGEPGGLPSMGSHGVGHVWSDLAAAAGTSFKYGFSQIKILYGSQTKRVLG